MHGGAFSLLASILDFTRVSDCLEDEGSMLAMLSGGNDWEVTAVTTRGSELLGLRMTDMIARRTRVGGYEGHYIYYEYYCSTDPSQTVDALCPSPRR